MGIAAIIAADLAATYFDADASETPTESTTYTTAAGVASDPFFAGWLAEDPAAAAAGQFGESKVRTARVIIAASDVAAPARLDTVTRTSTSEVWTIIGVDPIGGGAAFSLAVKITEPVERSREGYRPTRH